MTRRAAAHHDETEAYAVIAAHPIDLPDGRTGIPGEQVDLSAADASPLLADGHIVTVTHLEDTKTDQTTKPAAAGNEENPS